jgi:hypothetical protein
VPDRVGVTSEGERGAPGADSLSVGDVLASLRDDIRAEDTLIASRTTWYVTSQAFLLTAYATSWTAHFEWPGFFHQLLPVAAIALSALILSSVYAATWAQDVYLREQTRFVARVKAEIPLSQAERLALEVYERTMVENRTNADGRVVGRRIHALVRIAPLALPVAFSLLWLVAIYFAPA